MTAFTVSRTPAFQNIPLAGGWEMASTEEHLELAMLGSLAFVQAHAPATAASVLRQQNMLRPGEEVRFDAADHWFRCRFESAPCAIEERLALRFEGIATLSEVWLNGEVILACDSMFASHEVDVSALIRENNELVIACRSLARAMREQRTREPRPRWRTRLVADQQLRWFRTTLLGRAPGFSRGPEPVGPWRPVTLIRRRDFVLEQWTRHTEIEGHAGVLRAKFRFNAVHVGARPVSGRMICGDVGAPVEWLSSGHDCGSITLRIPDAAPWWPHTHGEPALYPVRLELQLADGSTVVLDDAPAGFRSIRNLRQAESGLALEINGVPIFCRGVVWTPADVVSLASPDVAVCKRLELIREAGFNLVRIAGTTFYETDAFHRICDELGLLVWQDMMFANMDYPFTEPAFRGRVRSEAETELSRFGRHPSSAIICGNSEIEQQVAMLGLDPALGRGEFFYCDLPRIAARCCPGIPYIASAPYGGDLPFRTRAGVSNYFGVGAYMRPIADARRSAVGFASECLALANVPEPEMMASLALATPGGIGPGHPCWKRGIPRDSGTGWDFEDVRDYYLKLLYSVDPTALRYSDPDYYWELSRLVSGEVMAEVFNEWRRPESTCAGGIILWCADLEPGAGWGILDSGGVPKAPYWFLKRALSPCSVWTTDEGLNGIDVYVANDRPEPIDAFLRVAAWRRGEHLIAGNTIQLSIPAHGGFFIGAEAVLGRFIDASYAYRFGPPSHDLVVASLHREAGDIPFAQAFHFPVGRAATRTAVSELGLRGEANLLADGKIELILQTARFAWGVKPSIPGFLPDDVYFGIEPSGKRRVIFSPVHVGAQPARCSIRAANADGICTVALPKPL